MVSFPTPGCAHCHILLRKTGVWYEEEKEETGEEEKWNAKKEEEEEAKQEEIKTHERLKKNSFSQDKTVQDFDKEAFFPSNERIFILYENPKETAL